MMTSCRRMLCAMALVSPAAFAAQGPGGAVDLYFIPQIEIEGSGTGGSATADGDGFGIRGMIMPAPQFAITGEYQASTLEDDSAGGFTGTPGSDLDFDAFRFGGGFLIQGSSGVFAEYISGEFEAGGGSADVDGFAIHGRLGGNVSPELSLYGQIGWLLLNTDFFTSPDEEDADGYELNLGGAFNFTKQVGVFLDYRFSSIEGDTSQVELETSEFRVGGRLNFGG